MDHVFSHVGIGVSDMARSARFYCEGLGFVPVGPAATVDRRVAGAIEIAGDMTLRNMFLRRQGITLELLQFISPAPTGTSVRRPMTQLGVTHLSFGVSEDFDVLSARITSAGGEVLSNTHLRYSLPAAVEGAPEYSTELIFCTDPDGVRIELMRLSPAWWRRLHPPED